MHCRPARKIECKIVRSSCRPLDSGGKDSVYCRKLYFRLRFMRVMGGECGVPRACCNLHPRLCKSVSVPVRMALRVFSAAARIFALCLCGSRLLFPGGHNAVHRAAVYSVFSAVARLTPAPCRFQRALRAVARCASAFAPAPGEAPEPPYQQRRNGKADGPDDIILPAHVRAT